MAMTWFQQMFTPQRPGPGQMAWRDKDVGEGSGEISQGDIQEMYWQRTPAKLGNRGQMSTTSPGSVSNPLPGPQAQTGTGLTAKQDFMAGMDRIRNQISGGLGGDYDSEGMSNAFATMQPSFSGPIADELDIYGVSSPGTMNRSTMTPGSRRWSGVSDAGANALPESWIQAPNAFQAPTPSLGDVEGMDISVTDIVSPDPLYRDRIRRAGGNITFPDKNPNPTPPGVEFIKRLLSGVGDFTSGMFSPGDPEADARHALAVQNNVRGAGMPPPVTPNDGFGASRAQDYMDPTTPERESIFSMLKPSNYNPVIPYYKKMLGSIFN